MPKVKGYLLEEAPEGLYWASKEEISKLWNSKSVIPIKEIELLPLWVTNAFVPPFCVQALILGMVKAYSIDQKEIEKVKNEKGVDIEKQEPFYKDALLSLFDSPSDKNLERSLLNILTILKETKGNEYVVDFYQNASNMLDNLEIPDTLQIS